MSWELSDRKSRLPRDWESRRRRILARDGGVCQMWRKGTKVKCGAPANQVDHRKRGDDHSPSNLWALCERCHGVKTRIESAEARRETKARLRPLEDKHPGLL